MKGIEFQDENLSPEASIAWQATDSTNLYAAFKTGFKSGGIDNSALPSAGLNPLTNPTFAEDLVFGSETAMGFEVGAKNDFTFGDNTVRANLTFYRYVYEDLQVQLFNTSQLAFVTTNASELTNKGVELESIWETPLDGLSINLNFAWVDTVLTKDFFVDGGEGIYNCAPVALGGSTLCDLSLPDTNGNGTREANLKGTRAVGVGKYNGNFGFDFARPLGSLPLAIVAGSNHQFESKFDTNVGDWSDYYQDFYFKHDAYFGMGDADGRWQLSVVGTNLADKITVNGSGGRPFTVSQGQAGNPREELDQVLSFSRGRQVTLEGSINF